MPGSSRRAARPGWVEPQLATLTDAAPSGDDWLHEIKYDGYRLLAVIEAADVTLWTRNRKDWTSRFPAVSAALTNLGLEDTVLDGEVAVETEGGATSFQALQNVLADASRGQLRFYVFDALWLSGDDLRRLPLSERKARLREVLGDGVATDGVIRYSDHVQGRGPAFFEQACGHGLEGIISKRAAAPYRSGRGRDWLKVKCVREQEFVIGGYTEPGGSRSDLGALHVGSYDERGRLEYRGKVGTGFTAGMLRDLRQRLEPLRRDDSPFVNPPRGAAVRGTHWVEPRLVAQIRYTELTSDGRLRHPAFQGLREDKAAEEVELEQAKTGSRTSRASRGSAEIAGVRLSSPDKVLYPEAGLTKLDLARYYEAVAPWILPHIRGRPLTLVRCPSGHEDWCFFQKHIDDSAPAALRRVTVEESDGPETYAAVDDVAGLVSLAQIGALELHTFNARADRLDRPDRFVIDLDPDEGLGWDRVVEAAGHVREVLDELGLRSFLKVTGGKGLHVAVPLTRRAGWDEVKEFSRAVASLLARAAPDRYTTELSKKKRRGRILLDWLRNAEGATAVEAYSTRARAGAPVAAPITWDELERGVEPNGITLRTMPDRMKRLKQDPWSEFGSVRQSITAAMRKRVGA